jgi:hypothetical protein
MGPVSCGFIFFEAKNIKASAATHLETTSVRFCVSLKILFCFFKIPATISFQGGSVSRKDSDSSLLR